MNAKQKKDLYNVYKELLESKKNEWELNDNLFSIGLFLGFLEGIKCSMTKTKFYNYNKLTPADMHDLLKSGYKFQVQLTNEDDTSYDAILTLVDSEKIENEGCQYKFICDDKVTFLYTPAKFVVLQVYFPNGVGYDPEQ